MKLPITCGECGGALQEGFVVDAGYGVETVSTWQQGEPQKRWWAFGGIVQAGAARMEITTLRCERCGVLKSYAIGE